MEINTVEIQDMVEAYTRQEKCWVVAVSKEDYEKHVDKITYFMLRDFKNDYNDLIMWLRFTGFAVFTNYTEARSVYDMFATHFTPDVPTYLSGPDGLVAENT